MSSYTASVNDVKLSSTGLTQPEGSQEAEYCIGEQETALILGEIHIHVNNSLLKRKSTVLLPKGSLEVPKKKDCYISAPLVSPQ